MAIEDFLRLFQREHPQPAAAPATDVVDDLVRQLKKALLSDAEFDRALASISSQKTATKAVLEAVFLKLFDRRSGVPKKATRPELLRLIADERTIVVRNEKMGKLLGRRPVAAE